MSALMPGNGAWVGRDSYVTWISSKPSECIGFPQLKAWAFATVVVYIKWHFLLNYGSISIVNF